MAVWFTSLPPWRVKKHLIRALLGRGFGMRERAACPGHTAYKFIFNPAFGHTLAIHQWIWHSGGYTVANDQRLARGDIAVDNRNKSPTPLILSWIEQSAKAGCGRAAYKSRQDLVLSSQLPLKYNRRRLRMSDVYNIWSIVGDTGWTESRSKRTVAVKAISIRDSHFRCRVSVIVFVLANSLWWSQVTWCVFPIVFNV